jgi:uncharacterized membrane protein
MARFREGTGTALLVAIGSFSVFAILAWVVAGMLWVALSIYALMEMIGDGRPSAVAVLMIVVLLVGTLVTLAAVGFGFLGKRLTPGKRDRD